MIITTSVDLTFPIITTNITTIFTTVNRIPFTTLYEDMADRQVTEDRTLAYQVYLDSELAESFLLIK